MVVGEFREIFNLYLWSNSQDFDNDHCQNGQLEI